MKLYQILLLPLLFSLLSGCGFTNDIKNPSRDADGDGWSELRGDCDDDDPDISPDGIEGASCNGFDDNCNGVTDEGLTHTFFPDTDNDGWGDAGADGSVGCFAESMISNFVENNGDCDDNDFGINPSATEVCDADGIDENCDGETLSPTNWYPDADGDGYGDWSEGVVPEESCEDPGDGSVNNADDCNDGSRYINPDATEVCDSIDNNCNGTINEPSAATPIWWADVDGDRFGDSSVQTVSCQFPDGNWVIGTVMVDGGEMSTAEDCDDTDPAVNPGAEEMCSNGVDDDCDTEIDETCP